MGSNMKNLLMYVILPGITGFTVSYVVVIPQILAFNPTLPVFTLASVTATGLLTFAMAAVLRGRLSGKEEYDEAEEAVEA